jgi:hypothetical protein
MSGKQTHVMFQFNHPKYPETSNMTKYMALTDFLPYLRDINIDPRWVKTISFSYGDLSQKKLDFLAQFTNLTLLSFYGNQMTTFPSVVWKLTSLNVLECTLNPVARIPRELIQLPNLKSYQGPAQSYIGIPDEYRDDYSAIIKYQDLRLCGAWIVRYAFLTLRCSRPVIHALYEAYALQVRQLCFPGVP